MRLPYNPAVLNISLFRLLLPFLAIFVFSGCGYNFYGVSSTARIAPAESLWVANIANTTVSPKAQTLIRRALYESGGRIRGLSPADEEKSADLVISGRIVSYALKAISYNREDKAVEYRLTLAAELEIRRKNEATPFWRGAMKGEQDFPVEKNFDVAYQHNAEEAAAAAVSRILAEKFFAALEQNY